MSELTKTDHAIGYLALDWLQFGEKFDEHKAEIALKYISQLKSEITALKDNILLHQKINSSDGALIQKLKEKSKILEDFIQKDCLGFVDGIDDDAVPVMTAMSTRAQQALEEFRI